MYHLRKVDSQMTLTARRIALIVKGLSFLAATFALTTLGTILYPPYSVAPQDRSTYSIIAMDPDTGDVGAAGASCVPISAASLAALAPGQGVTATQAAASFWNQTKVFDLLRQGATASEIIRVVTAADFDSEVGIRQYGAVTLHQGSVQTVGFTGLENNDWAGDLQDSSHAVSVQGNTLESEAVVSDALAAFSAADIGSVRLPDRLMRALEAASAAGGDRRCNSQSGLQQTAQAAFIMVARPDQPPFAAPFGKEPSPNDPSLPWLYISFVEAKGGPNPLLELRSRYNAWRTDHLPPCPDCDLEAIPVPSGGAPSPLVKTILNASNRIGLGLVAGICCLAGILLVIAVSITLISMRRRHSSA
jgi:uncharacterized Ntn-hydrolase superfamily protein